MNMIEVQRTFLLESRELLEEMERALLALEHTPHEPDLINAVFRAAHTIKGSGGVFGFEKVQTFTHAVETVLDRLRINELTPGPDMVALLLECRDHMGILVEQAVAGEPADAALAARDAGLLDRLGPYLKAGTAETIRTSCSDPATPGSGLAPVTYHITVRFAEDVLRNGLDPLALLRYLRRLGELENVNTLCDAMPGAEHMDPECCYMALELDLCTHKAREEVDAAFEFFREDAEIRITPVPALTAGEGKETALKVSGILADLHLPEAPTMIPIADTAPPVVPSPPSGEPAQEKHERGRSLSERSIRIDADKLDALINLVGELVIAGASTSLLAQRRGDGQLLESISMVGRLVEEIRDSALRLRMVQIGETFNRFQRVVRDVSRELGKDIGLAISGADTELDKTVVEKIGDPLMHLIRNAMDHGIENAEERQAAGKPARGRVSLNAYHESGSIVIEVSDDGRGLNAAKILNKAIERGLIAPGQTLTASEIQRLVFEPGFSTAAQVTNLSGRGVGMDVVRRNIEALRGTIELSSQEGHGTTVAIRLPLTLAIIDGFLVEVGRSTYVIPLDSVLECIEVGEGQCLGEQAAYINLRGEVLPFLRLQEVFGEQRTGRTRENIVVVQYGGQKAGLVVDTLLGEFQTVIKPLGRIFERLEGISGATILGSGEVAVILDVPQLVQSATARIEKTRSKNLH